MKRIIHAFATKAIVFLAVVGLFSSSSVLLAQSPFGEGPVSPGVALIRSVFQPKSASQGAATNPEKTKTVAAPKLKAPEPIPLKKPVGKEVSMASPNAQKWFDEAMNTAKDWEFPDGLVNKYGKTVTREDFFKALIWIESNGVHQKSNGKITRSYVGALGFGQLMPKTAQSLKVNPNNAADNLKGMTKYIRDLFKAPNIKSSTGLEKLLKAACGYNMGPYSSLMKKNWDELKTKASRETVGYGIKLKMCLGFELTAWEKTTACKLLGATDKTIAGVIDEYYGHTQGLLMKN